MELTLKQRNEFRKLLSKFDKWGFAEKSIIDAYENEYAGQSGQDAKNKHRSRVHFMHTIKREGLFSLNRMTPRYELTQAGFRVARAMETWVIVDVQPQDDGTTGENNAR